uniref:Saposin B-type domain-containing protein n=1 Tax=Paramoeba aestuarina TaxID=180227 RepID=A0A7S4UQ82_9EUKA|mmetsp:Transcript_6435/g.9709  ORF Transcript_6435/g.9709 Transcript_6435/m.9709 type:complete len:136 (+) Transcript_6435:66-473(+)
MKFQLLLALFAAVLVSVAYANDDGPYCPCMGQQCDYEPPQLVQNITDQTEEFGCGKCLSSIVLGQDAVQKCHGPDPNYYCACRNLRFTCLTALADKPVAMAQCLVVVQNMPQEFIDLLKDPSTDPYVVCQALSLC